MRNKFKVDDKIKRNTMSVLSVKVGDILTLVEGETNLNKAQLSIDDNIYSTAYFELVPKVDPFAELKQAQKEGAVIQLWIDTYWADWSNVDWTAKIENYRIKPEPIKNLAYYDNLFKQGIAVEVLCFNDSWERVTATCPSNWAKTADKFRVKIQPELIKHTYAEWDELNDKIKLLVNKRNDLSSQSAFIGIAINNIDKQIKELKES